MSQYACRVRKYLPACSEYDLYWNIPLIRISYLIAEDSRIMGEKGVGRKNKYAESLKRMQRLMLEFHSKKKQGTE